MKKSTKKDIVYIGTRPVGGDNPVFIIAEAGINHNGQIALAKRLIDLAVEAGADAVKFQMRHLSTLYTKEALEDGKSEDIGAQYLLSLIKEADLSPEHFQEMASYAKEKGIMFLCTPWDKASVDALEKIGVPAFKIGSPDMTNLDLIEYVASKKKPLIISTGMSTIEEVRTTVRFLKKIKATYILLHCNSTYPPAAKDLNLNFIKTMKEEFGGVIGYSSQELGIANTFATIPLGAKVIERHFTLDRKMKGPDHAISLERIGIKKLVRDIRRTEEAMGTGKKYMTAGEFINRQNLAKSLVAAMDIKKGSKIKREMVTAKSPSKGISPQKLFDLVGRTAKRDIRFDEFFTEQDLGKPKIKKQFSSKLPWSLIVRPHDLKEVIAEGKPPIVEFHFSSRDISDPFEIPEYKNVEAIVHCPELWGDQLFDLSASDENILKLSIENANKVMDRAREIKKKFGKTPTKIKVVLHTGGMSDERFVDQSEKKRMYKTLSESLKKLNLDSIDLLLENLPPYPWYKGGQWFSNTFMDAQEIFDFCKEEGYGICYDSSHAQLWCNFAKKDPIEFFKTIESLVRHIHISDGIGVDGEGLQIGEGNVPFKKLIPAIKKTKASFSTEIWMGHRHSREGFWTALARLKKLGM